MEESIVDPILLTPPLLGTEPPVAVEAAPPAPMETKARLVRRRKSAPKRAAKPKPQPTAAKRVRLRSAPRRDSLPRIIAGRLKRLVAELVREQRRLIAAELESLLL